MVFLLNKLLDLKKYGILTEQATRNKEIWYFYKLATQ